MLNRFFQAVQGQFEHGEDLPDHTDGIRVVPLLLGLGIKPDGVAEGVGRSGVATLTDAAGEARRWAGDLLAVFSDSFQHLQALGVSQ